MERSAVLKKTMHMVRTGDAEAYENFYILTIDETYGKISALTRETQPADQLTVEVYCALYRQVHSLPMGAEDLSRRIEDEIYRQAEKLLGAEVEDTVLQDGYEKISEEKAVTLWLQIEEKAGLIQDGPEEEKNSAVSYAYSVFKVVLTVAVLIATTVVLYKGWQYFFADRKAAVSQDALVQEEPPAPTEPLILESEKKEPGWQQNPDGKLYYVTKKGITADGPIAIGKQTLTFSRDGELTLIGASRQVAENMNLSFDEDTRYEVRGGDIYRTDPESGEETCVVRNGHVVQADVRCGFLWYICRYQIPNSEQTKTTIYRALLDGGRQEEVYTTDKTLETDGFQLTSRWLYYLSEGRLYRKSLDGEKTEFLAEKVEYFFAWENTAYYMKDRTLESVSVGSAYSGTEAGYQIEKTDQGFVLLDAFGEPALESGNGEIQAGDRIYRLEGGIIQSVRPAERRSGDVLYYIDETGTDRKIYWKDSVGTRGLVRQEGLAADSLCIAGDWLYYSARVAQYGNECESQIYRLNLQTMDLERVGAPFRGYMRNLYYFDHIQTILGEYIPSVADPEQIHGAIAKVAVDEMGVLNDTGARPESEGSDMLELVMADGERIYCLYHRCSYDSLSGQMVWKSTEPVEIDISGYGLGGYGM